MAVLYAYGTAELQLSIKLRNIDLGVGLFVTYIPLVSR